VTNPGIFGNRRHWTARNAVKARLLAYRLWPELVGADASGDKKHEPTPSQRMSQLLRDGRNANTINTNRDPLQTIDDRLRAIRKPKGEPQQ
jgi:hypothetical protein